MCRSLSKYVGKGLCVMFPGNKLSIQLFLTQISRSPPPPLPGGYAFGEKVYLTGTSQTFSTGNKLTHGQRGEVTGPATCETHVGKGLDVMFPGNKGNISCYLTNLSRSPPPPLPGGYAVGEKVYFTGYSQTVDTGDKLTRGQEGEVMGPATHATHVGKGLDVKFPGNKGTISCCLTNLSRSKP